MGDLFKEFLNAANDRLPICGLEKSSFSYDLPEGSIAKIYGYLHRCTSIKEASSLKLLSERGYSMIELLEKCYVLRFSLAEMGTERNTSSSGASLLPEATAILAPVAKKINLRRSTQQIYTRKQS
jgi:hypothetical protein